jgi:hypothetical protein
VYAVLRGMVPMKQMKAVGAACLAVQLRHDVGFGSDTHRDPSQDGATAEPADKPALSPELIRRFEALVEEVTQELMQGGPCGDRRTCRADAVALLMAASEQLIDPAEDRESPLQYLLLEEQQRIAAMLGQAPGHRARSMLKV